MIAELDKYTQLLQIRQGMDGDPKDKQKQLRIDLSAKSGDVTGARNQWEDVILRHQDEVHKTANLYILKDSL